MRGRLGALGAALLVSVTLAACGSSKQVTVVRNITTAVGTTGATGPSGATARTSATAAVRDYYHLINGGRFERAWTALTPGLRSDLGGYYAWRRGYRFTLRTRVLDARVVQQGGGTATVRVRFAGDAKDACDSNVTQTFTGTWALAAVGGRWVATKALATRVSGPDVVDHVSDCPSQGSAGSASVPSYAPPPYTPPSGPTYTPPGSNIPNYENGNGYRVQCADGTYSQSGGIQGACSYHGGVSDP